MNFKKIGLLTLSLGAIFFASCGGGGTRKLNYEEALQFVTNHYKHDADDTVLINWRTASWDVSKSTGTHTGMARRMIGSEIGLTYAQVDVKGDKVESPGYMESYCSPDYFKDNWPSARVAEAYHATFTEEGGNFVTISDDIYSGIYGDLDCVRTEKWDGKGRLTYTKIVFDNVVIDMPGISGQLTGWIEFNCFYR